MKIAGRLASCMLLFSIALLRTFPQSAVTPPDYAGIGREAVSSLAQEQWPTIEARFDARMKAALPDDKLAVIWKQILAQAGAFKNITSIQISEKGDHHLAVVTCAFADSSLDVKVGIDSTGRIIGLFFSPSAAAASVESAWTPAPYAHPEAFQEHAVTVGSGTPWPLAAVLSLPLGKGPFPAIVLVHGSGPHDQDETIGPNKPFKDLAQGLASRGIAVLRYEKRTHVFPNHVSADGLYTPRDEVTEDAEHAVSLLSKMPEVDAKHIFLLGHSFGGTLAPRIAEEDSRIAGLVLMAGGSIPLEQAAFDQLKYIAALPGNTNNDALQQQIATMEKTVQQIESPMLRASDTINFLGASIPGSYFLYLKSYKPDVTAGRLHIPILVLQGGHDYQVTKTDYELWQKSLAVSPAATFHFYPNLTHLFLPASHDGPAAPADYAVPGHVATEVIADIADWVKTNSR